MNFLILWRVKKYINLYTSLAFFTVCLEGIFFKNLFQSVLIFFYSLSNEKGHVKKYPNFQK